MSHAIWLDNSVHPNLLKATAEHLAERIMADFLSGMEVEAIAVRGLSGMVVGSAVSLLTGLPLVLVRKEDETQRHSYHKVEYLRPFQDYIIIDDLVSSGDTIYEIMGNVGTVCPRASLSKIYLYRNAVPSNLRILPHTVPVYACFICWNALTNKVTIEIK